MVCLILREHYTDYSLHGNNGGMHNGIMEATQILYRLIVKHTDNMQPHFEPGLCNIIPDMVRVVVP
jgi:hypothetical protein